MSYFIISLDSGTTSTRAVLFNESGSVEITAAGLALMASITIGEKTLAEVKCTREIDQVFLPEKSVEWRERKAEVWADVISRVRTV